MRKRIKMIILLFIFPIVTAACGYGLGIHVKRSGFQQMTASEETVMDPLVSFRSERSRNRQCQVTQLNEMIQDETADPEIKAMAQRKLLELMNSLEIESDIEGMLSMRGFMEILAVAHEDTALVFVREELLTEQQVSIILECVMSKMKILGGNVKIIPIK